MSAYVSTATANFAAGCGRTGSKHFRQPPTIGFLSPAVSGAPVDAVAAFEGGLAELGFVEGRDIVIEWGSAGRQDQARLDDRAVDLVRRDVEAIVTVGSLATRAALRASAPKGELKSKQRRMPA